MSNSIIISTPTRASARLPISREVRAVVWDFARGQCWYCGNHCNPFYNYCVDHVVPVCRGGTNEIENLVPCCTDCNQSKGTLFLYEWRRNFERVEMRCDPPWDDASGLFWYEREPFFQQLRHEETRGYRRYQARLAEERRQS
jgi:hypothetical protein